MDGGWLIAWVLAVIFLATLIRSAFGFGEGLVALPLLALLIPVEVAAPLAVLFSITVAIVTGDDGIAFYRVSVLGTSTRSSGPQPNSVASGVKASP